MSERPIAIIIEDDEDSSFIFAEAVRTAGFEAEIVRDGRDAVERLQRVIPDMIILDLHLPHVAGTDILAKIRQTEALQKVKVVVTTADARLAEEADAQADFVLIKPISFTMLRDLAFRLSGKGTTASLRQVG